MEAALARGIAEFNAGEYFAAHESLEHVWQRAAGPRRLFLQGLIHVAVGLYHLERGNHLGARRQLDKGLRKLAGHLPVAEGLDTAALYRDARRVWEQMAAGEAPAARPRIRRVEGG